MPAGIVTSHPGCEVTAVAVGEHDVTLDLSDGERRTVDFVVFASGYRADLARVSYLGPVLDDLSGADGFPDLTEDFETSLPGLYMTGFVSTRDFGPFFGFTKGCPASARIAVTAMMQWPSVTAPPGRRPEPRPPGSLPTGSRSPPPPRRCPASRSSTARSRARPRCVAPRARARLPTTGAARARPAATDRSTSTSRARSQPRHPGGGAGRSDPR